MNQPTPIRAAIGKLGILLPGLGAVATTTMAGVFLARRGLASAIGSLTQVGTIRTDTRSDGRAVRLVDFLPLASLDDIAFGAWDVFPDDAFAAAEHARVLDSHHLEAVREELSAVRPMPAAFYPEYVRRLQGTHVKTASCKAEMVEQLRDDIRTFKRAQGCSRLVAVWCGSTEIHLTATAVHESIRAFEDGLRASAAEISASQLYAWACILERVPFANGSPSLTADFPAARALAREHRVPLAGKDFKTGQTLLKTIIAPGLKARALGLRGWYSTNLLGNRDGEVLEDPASFRTKELSKLGVLEAMLSGRDPDLFPAFVHKVGIDYYPPRGDAKEAWDSIDLFGWLGYPMQLKMNFLCRDSILAAPLVLDLALFLDLSQRADLHGTQEWLGFYFKSPMTAPGCGPEHDLSAQLATLEKKLCWLMGGDTDPGNNPQSPRNNSLPP
jgi:myo-inositol-1-phosphate synthase